MLKVKDIGKIIRKVRRSQGLTQEQLAAFCGCGRRFIIELENGKPGCHFGKIIQVLSALGIELHAANRKGDI